MKKEITTSIEINASAEIVWNVLTDFEKYPEWNPFIHFIKGEPIVGQTVHAKIQNMNFKPKVLVFDKNREFKWIGKLLFKGLFDGEHRFFLTENSNGTTTLMQSEKFSGVLVKLFSKKLEKETYAGFIEMNEALKERSEKSASH
jgi:hypothetical protein|tara:strand:+ start:10086 stop:10517 length:432 start_codon:yes stop_codon:yes gene_type:complete